MARAIKIWLTIETIFAYTTHNNSDIAVFTGWPEAKIRQNREVGATPTQSRYCNWRVIYLLEYLKRH